MRMKATAMLAFAALLPVLGACGSADNSAQNSAALEVAVLSSDAIEVNGATATYTHGDGGAKTQIHFPVPERADPIFYHDVQRTGEGGGVVAVLDSYGSRNGGERCADGRETWLRLFSLTRRRLTDSVLVESCLDQREAGDPPVTWQGESFTINGKEPRSFKIVEGKAQSEERR